MFGNLGLESLVELANIWTVEHGYPSTAAMADVLESQI